jgi:hypothetical protein
MGTNFEAQPTKKGTYEIRLIAPSGSTVTSTQFLPTISEIQGSEQLARPLQFNMPSSNLDIPMFRWDFAVPTMAGTVTETWAEDFSSVLRVVKIRVFEENQGGRRYFRLSRLLENDQPFPLAHSGFCSPNPQDGTEITGDSCPDLLSFTPTYNLGDPGLLIKWGVELIGPPQVPENAGLSGASHPFLELTVQNANSTALPYLYPEQGRVGGVTGIRGFLVNPPFRLLSGDSPRTWRITIGTTGHDGGDFVASLATGESLPRTMRPGGSLPINVEFRPTSPGTKTASLEVSLVDDDTNAPQLVTVPLQGDAQTPYPLSAIPSSLLFQDPPPMGDYPLTKRMLVANDGIAVAVRGPLTIEAVPNGGDPSSFHILDEQAMHPPRGAQVLLPGQSETLTIAYCPRGAGPQKAQLRISSGLWPADTIVPLEGTAHPPFSGTLTHLCPP